MKPGPGTNFHKNPKPQVQSRAPTDGTNIT